MCMTCCSSRAVLPGAGAAVLPCFGIQIMLENERGTAGVGQLWQAEKASECPHLPL